MDPALRAKLTPTHLRRLKWFDDRTGTISNYPAPLDDGLLVVSRPKGIYKPQDLAYAVSIRIQLDSPYPDGDVIPREDGSSWIFAYHQENDDPAKRDAEFTNRGLMETMKAGLPVGVLRERERALPSARTEYDVLGLAYPVAWKGGYFYLDSNPASGVGRDIVQEVMAGTAEEALEEEVASTPPPGDDYDARLRELRQIVARRGQQGFRRALLKAYDGSCAITGCSVAEILEAAHLRPYRGPQSQVPSNGLLLRTDLHTLVKSPVVV